MASGKCRGERPTPNAQRPTFNLQGLRPDNSIEALPQPRSGIDYLKRTVAVGNAATASERSPRAEIRAGQKAIRRTWRADCVNLIIAIGQCCDRLDCRLLRPSGASANTITRNRKQIIARPFTSEGTRGDSDSRVVSGGSSNTIDDSFPGGVGCDGGGG